MEWWNGILEWNTGILEWNSYMRRTVFFHVFDVCQFSSCLGGLINVEKDESRGSTDSIVIDSDESCCQSSPMKIVPGQKLR